MLARIIKVDRDGSVSMQGDMRVMYTTMLKTRIIMIHWAKVCLRKGLLIALRYSIVRR